MLHSRVSLRLFFLLASCRGRTEYIRAKMLEFSSLCLPVRTVLSFFICSRTCQTLVLAVCPPPAPPRIPRPGSCNTAPAAVIEAITVCRCACVRESAVVVQRRALPLLLRAEMRDLSLVLRVWRSANSSWEAVRVGTARSYF